MRLQLLAFALVAFAGAASADPLFTYTVNSEPPAPLISTDTGVVTQYPPFYLYVDGAASNGMFQSGDIDLHFAPVTGYVIKGYTLTFSGDSAPGHYPGDVSAIEVSGTGFDYTTGDPDASFTFAGSALPVLHLSLTLTVVPDFCLDPGNVECGQGPFDFHETASLTIDSIAVTPDIVSVASIPEPTTWLMLMGGLGLAPLLRRGRASRGFD